jgi:hypothetical protein
MGGKKPANFDLLYADILFSSFLAAVLVKYTLSTLHVVFICATNCSLFTFMFKAQNFMFLTGWQTG